MQILRGLGFKPPASVVNAVGPVATSNSAAGSGVGTAIPEGACTSDGKLRWSYTIIPTGAWHVVAPTETVSMTTTIDSATILSGSSGQTVHVGPFPLPSPSVNSSIIQYDDPSQLSTSARTWLAGAAAQAMKQIKQNRPDLPQLPMSLLCDVPTLQGDPGVVVTDKDSNGLPIHRITYLDASKGPYAFQFRTACDWLEALQGGLSGKITQGWGGLMATSWYQLGVALKQFDPTADPNNPTTWSLKAPGLGFGVMDLASMFNYYDSAKLINKDNFPIPLTRFKHPVTGDDWGVWASLNLDTTKNGANEPGTMLVGQTPPDTTIVAQNAFFADAGGGYLQMGLMKEPSAWNSAKDAPNGYHLEIGFGKIQQNSFIFDLIQVIMWLPSQIANAAVNVIDQLKNLVCSDPAQALQLAKQLGPAGMAAFNTLALTCPPPPQPCPDGSIAPPGAVCTMRCSDGSIVPVTQGCPTPWYLQWYTLALAAGLVAVGAVHVARSHSK